MEGSSSKSMDFDQMGLKVLTNHREWDHTNHKSSVVSSSMLSPASSCSSDVMGDYIGTESCFDVLSDENDVVSAEPSPMVNTRVRARGRRETAPEREFPPPIPLLARTENLSSHMPWVMKRVYTSDGRLILREEKVRHHEYFRAHRSNGRLTLQLVPLDDDVLPLALGRAHFEDDDNDDDGDFVPHDDHNNDRYHPHVGHVSCAAEEVNIARDVDNRDDDDGVGGGGGDYIHHDVDHVCGGEGDIEEAGSGEIDVDSNGRVMEGRDDNRRMIMLSQNSDQMMVESVVGSGGSPAGKCWKSCFLTIQVPKIRPVLS